MLLIKADANTIVVRWVIRLPLVGKLPLSSSDFYLCTIGLLIALPIRASPAWSEGELQLQVRDGVTCSRAELREQKSTLPALNLQSNPQPREPSFHALLKHWEPNSYLEGMGAEFINMRCP